MLVLRIAYFVGWGAALFLIFRYLARYGSDARQLNSRPYWWGFDFLGGMKSPDTTVSAYARQVHEHARMNDEHAGELTEHITVEEFERTETETHAYTEQPPK